MPPVQQKKIHLRVNKVLLKAQGCLFWALWTVTFSLHSLHICCVVYLIINGYYFLSTKYIYQEMVAIKNREKQTKKKLKKLK